MGHIMSIYKLDDNTYDCTCVSNMNFRPNIPYTQNNWQVKYLTNRSKIVVGITLIWRKAVTVSKCNSYRPETALFKFGGLKIIRQTAKLNTPPIILRIRYVYMPWST